MLPQFVGGASQHTLKFSASRRHSRPAMTRNPTQPYFPSTPLLGCLGGCSTLTHTWPGHVLVCALFVIMYLRPAEGVWRHALPSLALCGIHGLGARQAPGASLVHPLRAVSSWIALLGGRWIVCPCWARPACPGGLGCIAEGGRYKHFLTVPHGWDGGVRLPEAGLVPRCAGRHALLAKRRGVLPFLSMRPGPCRSPCLRLTEKGKP